MEERLKKLKKTLDETSFKQIDFTEKHRQTIQHRMQTDDLKQSILELLNDHKSGYEIAQLLHIKGEKSIRENEGLVYTLLHQSEAEGLIQASWHEGTKYYTLTKRGLRSLAKKENVSKATFLERLKGVRMHAN